MARPQSKVSEFIMSFPASVTAREVVAKAKAGGMVTSENNVYRVRRLFGGKKSVAPASRRAPMPAAKPATGPRARQGRALAVPARVHAQPSVTAETVPLPSRSNAAEEVLRAVAAEIGLGRAVEILMGERARVHAMMRR